MPGLARVAERRDRLKHRVAMAGNVDLGDDRDAERRGAGDEGPHVPGRIDPAVAGEAAAEERRDGEAVAAPRRDRRELGIAGDVEPPALVVAEVEVEHVQLVPGEAVDEPRDLVRRIELPGDVEMRATEGEARRIVDEAELREDERPRAEPGAAENSGPA